MQNFCDDLIFVGSVQSIMKIRSAKIWAQRVIKANEILNFIAFNRNYCIRFIPKHPREVLATDGHPLLLALKTGPKTGSRLGGS